MTQAMKQHIEALPGLTTNNFRKIAPNGFGDPLNCYPHSMIWFHDHLYVGTTRANLANRGIQVSCKTPERLGTIWPVEIPDDSLNNDLRAQIWRYHPPTGTWSSVYVSPMIKGIEGNDVPLSLGFRTMALFQGRSDSAPALYAPTWGAFFNPNTVMLRSSDGINFKAVSEPGQCVPDHKLWGLRGMVVFKNRLFVSPAAGKGRHESSAAGFTGVLASSDPARGDWQLTCEPYFGDPNNLSVFHMAVFNGYLYAGTLNINEGYQVWKTDAEGEPPFQWKKVISHGAYREKLNQIAMTLVPFKGHLYIGSGIQNGGFDFDHNIGPAAPELIRLNPDDSWDLIFGEPRITNDGLKVPLSGYGPGLGNPFSGYIWSMCAHQGWLYLGTSVWTIFLRFSGKEESWPDSLRNIFTQENVERLLHEIGGCDLWRSRDGSHWIPITQNGFDNCFNLGFRTLVSTPYGLFVGAANSFAPNVAVKRIAGWQYEANRKGGLEIWLGSNAYTEPIGEAHSLIETPNYANENVLAANNKASEAEVIEKTISQFYEGSGFRHLGFWQEEIDGAVTACENLMEEILAFIPEKKGAIIDIGCGQGATTQYLLKYFSPEAITAITTKKKYLAICQTKVPGAQFLYRKLPQLMLPPESFDFVICVKGFEGLCTRTELLRESFSLLKPGGRLVFFDCLPAALSDVFLWKKIIAQEDYIPTLVSYRNILVAENFEPIHINDVTSQCLEGFKKHMARFLTLKNLSGEIKNITYKKMIAHLLMDELPIEQCLLISCLKPGNDQSAQDKKL